MKKQTGQSLAVIVLSLLLTLACTISIRQGSGKVVKENREVSGFDKVSLAGIGELHITQGNEESLSIEAEDNIVDKIRTEVRDGTLVISFAKNFNIVPTQPIRFNLTMKEVRGIELSGAGSVNSTGIETDHLAISITGSGGISIRTLSAQTLSVNVSGSGSMSIASLDAETLTANLTGAGGIEMDGKLKDQNIILSGAGSYHAGSLESDNTSIEISGMGSGDVWANHTLEVQISGAGSLDYCGNPKLIQHITGAGKVSGRGDC